MHLFDNETVQVRFANELRNAEHKLMVNFKNEWSVNLDNFHIK